MEVTIQKQLIKQVLTLLLAVTTVTFARFLAPKSSPSLQTSMIKEGTIVVKNDSVTKIIIQDKRDEWAQILGK